MHNSTTSSVNSSSSQQYPPAEPMIDKRTDPKLKIRKKIKPRVISLDNETHSQLVKDQKESLKKEKYVLSLTSSRDHKESLYIYLRQTLDSKNLSPYQSGMDEVEKQFAAYFKKENNSALLIILSKIVRGALQDSLFYFANPKEVEKLDREIKILLQLIINYSEKKISPQESVQESLIQQLKKADQFLFERYPSNVLGAGTRIAQYINQVLENEKVVSSDKKESGFQSKIPLNPLLASVFPLLKYSLLDQQEFKKADGFGFNLFDFTKDHSQLLIVTLRIITRTMTGISRDSKTDIQCVSNYVTLEKIQNIFLSKYLQWLKNTYFPFYDNFCIIDIEKYKELIALIIITNSTDEQTKQMKDHFYSILQQERNDKRFNLKAQKLIDDLKIFLHLTPDECAAAIPFVIMEKDTLEVKNETETSATMQESRRLKLFARIIWQTINNYNKNLNPPNAELSRISAKLISLITLKDISAEDFNETLSRQISLTYQLFCKYQLMYCLPQQFLLTEAHCEADDDKAKDQNSDQLVFLDNEARLRILGLHESNHEGRVPIADSKLIPKLIKNKLQTLSDFFSPFLLDNKEQQALNSYLSQDFHDLSVLNRVCGYLLAKTPIWTQRLQARFKALQAGAALIECKLTISPEVFQDHLKKYHSVEMSQACEELKNSLTVTYLALFDKHCHQVARNANSPLAPELYDLISTILRKNLAALQFSAAKHILDQVQQLNQNKKFTTLNTIHREFTALKNNLPSSRFVTESVVLAFNQAVLAFDLDRIHLIVTAIKQKNEYFQLFSALQMSNAADLDEKQTQAFLAITKDDKDIIEQTKESEKLYKKIEAEVINKVNIRIASLAEEIKLGSATNREKRSTMDDLKSKIAAHNSAVLLFNSWRQAVDNQSRLQIPLIFEESKAESKVTLSPTLSPSLPIIANLELKPLSNLPTPIAVPELKTFTTLPLLNAQVTQLTAANIALTTQNRNFEQIITTTTANIDSSNNQMTTHVAKLEYYQTQLEKLQRVRLHQRRQAIIHTRDTFNQLKARKSNIFSENHHEEEKKPSSPSLDLLPVVEQTSSISSSPSDMSSHSLDQHLQALQSHQHIITTSLNQISNNLQTADCQLLREMTEFRDSLIPGNGGPHMLLDRLITQTWERIKEYDSRSPFLTQSAKIETEIKQMAPENWQSNLNTENLAAIQKAKTNSIWQSSYKKNVRVCLTKILILLQQLKKASGHDHNFGIITTLLNEYEQLVNPQTTSVWEYLCCCFGRKPATHVKTDYTVAMEQDLGDLNCLKNTISEQITLVQFRNPTARGSSN